MPATTERYNSEGDYIGYEETYGVSVNTETLPRCSNCYSVLEFPNATSKKELFYAKRDKLLKIYRNRKPVYPGSGGDIWNAVLLGGIAGIITAALTAEIIIGILVGVGVGYGGSWLSKPSHLEKKKYEDRIAHWNKELDELKSFIYSDENYERLIKPQLSKEALEKHKEVLSRTEVEEVMGKILEKGLEKAKEEAWEDEMFQRMLRK